MTTLRARANIFSSHMVRLGTQRIKDCSCRMRSICEEISSDILNDGVTQAFIRRGYSADLAVTGIDLTADI
jgi:hypothetical protein